MPYKEEGQRMETDFDAINESYLDAYVESITTHSKYGGGFVCPLCNSGNGANHTGAFFLYRRDKREDGKKLFKCQSCGAGGDIYDLYAAVNNVSLKEASKAILERFQAGNAYIARKPQKTQQTGAEGEKRQTQEEQPQPDFSDFFLQAERGLEYCPDLRGISLATLRRFHVGYVKNWRYPLSEFLKKEGHTRAAWERLPSSPRWIIPLGKGGYLARDLRRNLPENATLHKQKIGKQELFNIAALSTAQDFLFIAEGEFDAMALEDVGATAIGLGGKERVTAFISLIEKHRPKAKLVLALDNDPPGEQAKAKLVKRLIELSIPFAVMGYEGKDPNAALELDRDALAAAVQRAKQGLFIGGEMEEIQEQPQSPFINVGDFLDTFNSIRERNKSRPKIKTGFADLDYRLSGSLSPGLYILGGLSSTGKTAFALQLADQLAMQGQSVLYFALEMSKDSLIARSISRLSYLAARERDGDFDARQTALTIRDVLEGGKDISPLLEDYGRRIAKNLWMYSAIEGITVERVKDYVETFIKDTGRRPVVCLDYMQILRPPVIRGRAVTDKQVADENMSTLMLLAHNNEIPVIAISAFNRASNKEGVSMASYRDSSGVEYGADVLLAMEPLKVSDAIANAKSERELSQSRKDAQDEINQEAADGAAYTIVLHILKNRGGPRGKIELSYRPKFNLFEDMKQPNSNVYKRRL